MLSWACTVLKVQGLSLTSAVVSFDLEKQNSFNEGQIYVALSRITSIDNIFLIGKYNRNFFKVMKVLLLNITDYEKTDLTLLIQIMLIAIVLQYHF